jgi:hypothetical protein
VEYEKDEEGNPKHALPVPTPEVVNPYAREEKSEVDALREPFVPAESLANPWEPSFLSDDRATYEQTYQDSQQDWIGR